eukprot:393357_1
MQHQFVYALALSTFLLLWFYLKQLHNPNDSLISFTSFPQIFENNISCKHPTNIIMPYRKDHGFGGISIAHFIDHEFNQNCSLHGQFFCQQYNNAYYSKYYCNGGYIRFGTHYNGIIGHFGYSNHFSNGIHVHKKSTLHRILRLYCSTFSNKSNNICNFMLRAYEIKDTNQRIEFLSKQIDCTNKAPQPNNTWVFKENKHRGMGVHFSNNHHDIYQLIFPNKSEQCIHYKECNKITPIGTQLFLASQGFTYERILNTPKRGYRVKWDGLLMQKFISNPLLINKHIFHVRSNLLIASFKPLIVCHYPDAMVQISTENFDPTLSNQISLRSNFHVAEQSALYQQQWNDTCQCSNIDTDWGYKRFQRYLDEVYGEPLFNYTTNKLPNDIFHIAQHVFNANAYWNKMHNQVINAYNETNNELNWNLFCMDIAITDDFQLKLMEINFHCGLVCHDVTPLGNDGYPWWCHGFAKDAANILLEVYNKKIDNIPITTIDSLGTFELVYLEQ